MHCRKGSALDYNGVYLSEGPWPGKAYFDAMRRARQRDASMYLDYGFTMPGIVSRGPYQNSRTNCYNAEETPEFNEVPELIQGEISTDELPEPTKVDTIQFIPFPDELSPLGSSQDKLLNKVGSDPSEIDSTLEITSEQIAEIGNHLRSNAASASSEFGPSDQWQPYHPLMLQNPASKLTTPADF